MQTRIRSFSVKGFRAYGAVAQTLSLPTDITVVWGPNSKGKTSLAEAFEFLLTGRITRRKLMASSQDEFADALRNAHLAAGEDVHVTACITAPDGTAHELTRVLTGDYTKRQDCTSRLEIDGATATEDDLAEFGFALSQPPLQAPVLAQHTLSYIFSVRPQERAIYFKTLLEVTDLDVLRNEIAALVDELKPPDDPMLVKFETCAAIPALAPVLGPVVHAIPDLNTLNARIADAAGALIRAAGEDVPETPCDRPNAIEEILADRRSKTFPVWGFERQELAGWNPPALATWTRLDTYLKETKKVDEETRQLAALFDEALKLPGITGMTEPADCPLCGKESALTPERVQLIRKHVEDTRDFKRAETVAKGVFSQLSTSAMTLLTSTEATLPTYFKMTVAKRRAAGFTVSRIRELLADRSAEFVGPWLATIRPFMRTGADLRRAAQAAAALVRQQADNMATSLNPQALRGAFDELATFRTRFTAAVGAYDAAVRPLGAVLNEIIDVQADTAGWQDFLDIAPRAHRTPQCSNRVQGPRYGRQGIQHSAQGHRPR